jgi:hypothetical protein
MSTPFAVEQSLQGVFRFLPLQGGSVIRIPVLLMLLLLVGAISLPVFAASAVEAAPPPLVPNDPAQNPLGATASIQAGFPGSLDTDVRLVVNVANPTSAPLDFYLCEALFTAGAEEHGQPLYSERMAVPALMPGQTRQLHFRWTNPEHVAVVSAYVLLEYNGPQGHQRTGLFVAGPRQQSLGDSWQGRFFPYGHISGLYADPWGFYAP